MGDYYKGGVVSIWKEEVVDYLKVNSWHLSGDSKGNHEDP